MTTWTLEQKNIVITGKLFNQSGLLFNTLGVQFGGINIPVWTLENKNT